MYQLLQNNFVQRLTDGAIFALKDGNTDYQAYLAWLAEGNEPMPADIEQPEQGQEQP